MTYHLVLTALTTAVGVGMNTGVLSQAWRAYRRKSSADVALTFPIVVGAGCCVWLLHGLDVGDPVLIVTNVLAITCYAVGIAVLVYYRRRRPPDEWDPPWRYQWNNSTADCEPPRR